MQREQGFRVVLAVVVAVFVSGCASTPKRITAETHAKVKVVGIEKEISTPTSLRPPANANAGQAGLIGALIDAGVQAGKQRTLTDQVREQFDFQKFAEETLRDSFSKAVTNRPGWILADPNSNEKMDAVFVLNVSELGVDDYHSHAFFFPKLEYQPKVTVVATLIGNPPIEIVGNKGGVVEVLDPDSHPILYQRKERISYQASGHMDSRASHDFVKHDGLMVYSWKYTGDEALTKEAFREAIELAVKRLADSWTVSP